MCRGKINFFRAAQADVDNIRPFVLNSTRHGLLKRLAGQAHVSAHDNRFWFEKTGIGPAYAVSDIFVKFFAQLATNVVGFKTGRSEEHTSELQSRGHLVCRLLLEK